MHTFITWFVPLLVMLYASTSCMLTGFSFQKGVRRGWPSSRNEDSSSLCCGCDTRHVNSGKLSEAILKLCSIMIVMD